MRATTVAVLLAALTATLVGVALAAQPVGGFAYGVAAGEITSTSAKLWTRAPQAGAVTLSVTAAAGARPARRFTLRALTANDLTAQRVVTGLVPATAYRYSFAQPGAPKPSVTGTFRTAPRGSANARVRFAISGDADATPGTNGKPGFNNYEVYGRMALERNDFNVNLGDTIYSDSQIAGSETALSVPAKWQKYRLGLALPALQRLRSSAGLYSHPGDHEYVNDFSIPEHGRDLYRAGVKAFGDYAPVSWKPASGFYRTFRWGKNLELFILDERAFRSAKVEKECGGDLAPTAPASVRSVLATFVPALAQPASPACRAAIDDPARTMLGKAQEAAFLGAIKRSNATFKVILNEVPIQQLYQRPYDRWEGYAAARTRLLQGLAGMTNVVFLTTDTHANLVGEVRLRTLEAPPEGTGIWEAITGPVATNTYGRNIERALGRIGASDLVTSLFLKPAPPVGIGLSCAAIDVFSYSEVVVTSERLTVTAKTAAGTRVAEKTGAICPPLIVKAR